MATSLMRRRETREPTSTLGRWEPLRTLRDWDPFNMMRELLRWDPFNDVESLGGPELAFIPRVNIQEKADAYEIAVELPGVQPDDIEIAISGNRLTISGERMEERTEGERYHAYERVYGRFSRTFMLPDGVDTDKVRAELRDGVLYVSIPKQAGAQAKRIPVEAGKGTQEQQQDKQVKVEKAAA